MQAMELETFPQEVVEDANDGVLTKEVMESSLSILGHNTSRLVVYSQSDLHGLQLRNVELLAAFKFLQKLILDDNKLTSLKPLAKLQSLVYLSVSRNELTETALSDLQGCSSTLESLHIDHNQLGSLEGLHRLPFLVSLKVHHNHIAELRAENFEGLACLMRANLSHNNITHVEPQTFCSAQNIRLLNLSHNEIDSVVFASYLNGNLDTLLMSHNHISHVGQSLSACKALTVLDFAHNDIAELSELYGLEPVTSLRSLAVDHNTFLDHPIDDILLAMGLQTSGEPEDRPVSRGEVAMDDVHRNPVTSSMMGSPVGGQYSRPSFLTLDADEKTAVDYGSLMAPRMHGLLRRIVESASMIRITWSEDKVKELLQIKKSRHGYLRLLYMFPHLTLLNGDVVVPEDIARASYFFSSTEDSDEPHVLHTQAQLPDEAADKQKKQQVH